MNPIAYKSILAVALVMTGFSAGHAVSAATKESQEVTDARQETVY